MLGMHSTISAASEITDVSKWMSLEGGGLGSER